MWTDPAVRLTLLAALVVFAGCGEEPESVAGLRWIEADPQRTIDRSAFVSTEIVLDLTPTVGDRDRWRSWGDVEVKIKDGEAVLDMDGRWGGLSREVDLDAAAVDAFEVSARGARRVMVDWAGPDGMFSPERRVEVQISPHTPATAAPIQIQLAGNSRWSGTIRALRISAIRAPNKETVTFGSVRALAERVHRDGLEKMAAQPWKVEVDHDLRNAVVGVPGMPVVREFEVPTGAVFRFGVGVEPRQPKAVTFTAAVDMGAGRERVVFRRRIGEEGRGVWHDSEIDLGDFSGTRIRLTLRVECDRLDPRLGVPAWSNPEVVAATPRRPPNVVVISIDTLRADRLSLYGYGRETSPVLDRWAQQAAVVFENAVAQAPWTLPSHVSLFTGLETFHHGVNFREQASPSLEMLAEYLRGQGHATVAITGGGFVHPSFGFSQGFDSYRYWSARYRSEQELEDGIERAVSWLERNGDRPFFMFFHTFEVHGPYRVRQPYYDQLRGEGPAAPDGVVRVMDGEVSAADGFRRARGFFTLESPEGSDRRTRLGEDALPMVSLLYDSQVAYMDAQIGRLLAALRASGPTTIVFTSDHGENIGERGDAGHGPLDDANVMVPLIVAWADGRGAGRRVRAQVRSIDIVPTLLDTLEISPAAQMDGQSLLSAVADPGRFQDLPGWSYNPAMNLGISVRLDGRLKYRFNDTAWDPAYGREAWVDLDVDPWEASADGVPWPGHDETRRWTSEALSGAVGWRLRISNRGPKAYSARLRSEALQPAKVKRLPGSGGSVQWRGHGRSMVVVEPGRDLTLSLLATGIPTVVVEADGSAEAELAPPDGDGSLPVRMAFTAGSWTADPETYPDAEVLVELWPVGQEISSGAEAEVDPELRERLEALGYVQ